MDKFDLKKYLAEGKLLKEKEGIEMAMELSGEPKDERIVKNNDLDKPKVKVTKEGAGLHDYKLVYKGVVAYAYKQEDGDWTMFNHDGYSNESGAWANSLRTLKQCKEDLMYAVDFEGHTNPDFKSKQEKNI